MKIFQRFRFEAAHRLPKVAPDHKCFNMHGHSYEVELVFEGKIEEDGMVVDFADNEDLWVPLHEALDHQVLNDRIDNPTAENIAAWIADKWMGFGLVRVTVWETKDCGAIWEAS